MAWQVHYTSVEAGPAGRAGFQFVAESAGLPQGLTGKIARHLAYKPPPGAPLAPSPEQIARMPVALAYGSLGPAGHPGARESGPSRAPGELSVLARCVYLGRDYSGRYGNFLGHAIVVTEEEMTGLRPVELWGSPLWRDVPASPGADLPDLSDLPPGDGFDPDALAAWLTSGGEAAYARLGELLETVTLALAGGHGRLVLVSADVDEIVRWIAVLSYSLPWPVAARLSFLTYSADPGGAPHLVVGTTPDVWLPADLKAAVFRLDDPPDAAAPAPGRFARTVADCWRRGDLDGIDAIGELSGGPSGKGSDGVPGEQAFEPDMGAALLAFCRGDATVTAEEQSAIARGLSEDLPEWLWDDLARATGRMGFELAAAVRAHAPAETAEWCALRCAALALADPALPTPEPARLPETRASLASDAARALAAVRDLEELGRAVRTAHAVGAPVAAADLERTARALVRDGLGDLARLLDRLPARLGEPAVTGVVLGLEESDDEVRTRMLTDEVSERLWAHDLAHAPRTGTAVVRSLARLRRLSRVEATRELLRLVPPDGPTARDRAATGTEEAGAGDDTGGRGGGAAAARDAGIAEIWEEVPGVAEAAALVDGVGAVLGEVAVLGDVPARAFLAAGLEDPETVRLAHQVRQAVPGYPAKDAEAVLLAAGTREAAEPPDAAAILLRLEELARETHEELHAAAWAVAAAAVAELDPRFRAEVVRRLPDEARAVLARAWIAARTPREEEPALLEVAVRLHLAGETVPELDSWARSRLGGWSMFGSVEARFRRDAELLAGLRELRDAARGRRGRKRGDR
ncbi:hypothetical protein Skr01_01610 [Sphaerisporangium krabiense]|uniref:Uncharacterized protein n=1 Tax=Sphaerisporangium krabiense TaxID=763782 RepID=A0A7W8Z7S6_9ACTN|nr:hypothetical protein [Sphaerisporangium krabiense]MBB5629084.1 hypothetical protein [Sphaerisporangium krabiense]GII60076.1 hypothetical protein Skr01_01610 [Sphaerisporangium krabiense]